jgi:AcrR family transcriptional regulator
MLNAMASATAFQRARRPEHKRQRREAIVAAARRLAGRNGVRNVSLGDVAREVGLAKSNVLRYFETREEIYLHLTAEGFRDWARALHARLDDAAADPADVADAVATTLAERPLFCDLLAETPANLEHNVSQDAVRAYKLAALQSVDNIARLFNTALPQLKPDGGLELLAGSTMLAAQAWQIASPPPALAQLYATDPVLARACIEFEPTLRRLTGALLDGLLNQGR